MLARPCIIVRPPAGCAPSLPAATRVQNLTPCMKPSPAAASLRQPPPPDEHTTSCLVTFVQAAVCGDEHDDPVWKSRAKGAGVGCTGQVQRARLCTVDALVFKGECPLAFQQAWCSAMQRTPGGRPRLVSTENTEKAEPNQCVPVMCADQGPPSGPAARLPVRGAPVWRAGGACRPAAQHAGAGEAKPFEGGCCVSVLCQRACQSPGTTPLLSKWQAAALASCAVLRRAFPPAKQAAPPLAALQMYAVFANAGSCVYYVSPLSTAVKVVGGGHNVDAQGTPCPRLPLRQPRGVGQSCARHALNLFMLPDPTVPTAPPAPPPYTHTPQPPAAANPAPRAPAPLRLQVFRTRTSASIHVGNSAMSVLNCVMWIGYLAVREVQGQARAGASMGRGIGPDARAEHGRARA